MADEKINIHGLEDYHPHRTLLEALGTIKLLSNSSLSMLSFPICCPKMPNHLGWLTEPVSILQPKLRCLESLSETLGFYHLMSRSPASGQHYPLGTSSD